MKLSSVRGVFAIAFMATMPVGVMSAELKIRFDGIDSIKFGTPLSKISIRLKKPIRKFDQQTNGNCFYAYPQNDKRYSLMFIKAVLTRIDVMQPGLRTKAGIEVGDPVPKVREAYGRALKTEPDFYDRKERYLTISSGDGKYSIRFTTSHGKVSSIIFGTAKSVQYVEGCL